MPETHMNLGLFGLGIGLCSQPVGTVPLQGNRTVLFGNLIHRVINVERTQILGTTSIGWPQTPAIGGCLVDAPSAGCCCSLPRERYLASSRLDGWDCPLIGAELCQTFSCEVVALGHFLTLHRPMHTEIRANPPTVNRCCDEPRSHRSLSCRWRWPSEGFVDTRQPRCRSSNGLWSS